MAFWKGVCGFLPRRLAVVLAAAAVCIVCLSFEVGAVEETAVLPKDEDVVLQQGGNNAAVALPDQIVIDGEDEKDLEEMYLCEAERQREHEKALLKLVERSRATGRKKIKTKTIAGVLGGLAALGIAIGLLWTAKRFRDRGIMDVDGDRGSMDADGERRDLEEPGEEKTDKD